MILNYRNRRDALGLTNVYFIKFLRGRGIRVHPSQFSEMANGIIEGTHTSNLVCEYTEEELSRLEKARKEA